MLLFETVKNLIFWIVTRVSTRDYTYLAPCATHDTYHGILIQRTASLTGHTVHNFDLGNLPWHQIYFQSCPKPQIFCTQVINAARILASRPKSKVAQENLDVFRDAWINQVSARLWLFFFSSDSELFVHRIRKRISNFVDRIFTNFVTNSQFYVDFFFLLQTHLIGKKSWKFVKMKFQTCCWI